jgi:hypothetical protein
MRALAQARRSEDLALRRIAALIDAQDLLEIDETISASCTGATRLTAATGSDGHGLLIPRREQVRRLSSDRHARDGAAFVGVEFAEIGIQFDGESLGRSSAARPMGPAPGTVVRAVNQP